MLAPSKVLVRDPIQPARNFESARKITVRLPGGVSYPAGQLLGEVQIAQRNERHTITAGDATGGTYRLQFADGQITANLAHNANAAAIATAVNAALGAGAVTVTGTGPWVIEYTGNEWKNRELMLPILLSALTGGTAHTIALTQRGNAWPTGCYAAVNAAIEDGRHKPKVVLEYPVSTSLQGSVKDQFGYADRYSVSAYSQGDFLASKLVGLTADNLADLGKLVSGAAVTTNGAIVRVG